MRNGALVAAIAALWALGCTVGERSPIVGDPFPTRDAGWPPPDRDAGLPRDGGFPSIEPVNADDPPAPVSGGTLLVTRNGAYAVAAEPDVDAVYVVDVVAGVIAHRIELVEDDEPGRLAEDGDRRVHVALRRGGALVTLLPATGEVLERRSVCAAPRGVAWEEATDLVHVACATGELVSLPASGGPAVRSVFVEPDLRDVAFAFDGMVVSTFRSAEVLVLDAAGRVVARRRPPDVELAMLREPAAFVPRVAYRMVAVGSNVLLLHQRASTASTSTDPGGYGEGDGCGGVVHTTVTTFGPGDVVATAAPMVGAALVTDMAVSPDGNEVVFARSSPTEDGVVTIAMEHVIGRGVADGCLEPIVRDPGGSDQTTAVAYLPGGGIVSQVRGVSGVEVRPSFGSSDLVTFGAPAPFDAGHFIFHFATRSGLACASCHPEAGEDGHTWLFSTERGEEARRTQTLGGGLLPTAPFHWNGDQVDMGAIMQGGFTGRMAGGELTAEQVRAMSRWLDALPALPGLAGGPKAIARGRGVFERTDVGCAGCHAGVALTDSRTVDVGTDGEFQVPSLRGVAHRGPWLHDGRAETLLSAFDGSSSTGGGLGGTATLHGNVSSLTPEEMSDLLAYVASL